MILSFSKHGTGGGKAPVEYVCGAEKRDPETNKKIKRSEAPELLRGDPKVTEKLIDSLSFKHKYTSLVISFTKDEFTKELAQSVLDDFEKAAFPGLEAHQFDYLAVLHTDTANPHIHVITPRIELNTGKSYNMAPPGSAQNFWADWSILTRDKFGLKQIESSSLDKSVLTKFEKQLLNKNRLDALPLSKAKFEIDQNIKQNIINGLLTNRSEVIDYLKKSGFEIARVTDKSISIKTQTKNIRFEGKIYDNTTSRNNTTYSQIATKTIADKSRNRDDNRRELETIKARFKISIKSKYDFNTKKFGTGKQEDRKTYSKLLLYNAPTIKGAGLLPTGNQQPNTNNKPSFNAQIKPKSSPNFSSGGGGSISAQISNIRAQISGSQNNEERENLRAILVNLIAQENEERYKYKPKID